MLKKIRSDLSPLLNSVNYKQKSEGTRKKYFRYKSVIKINHSLSLFTDTFIATEFLSKIAKKSIISLFTII